MMNRRQTLCAILATGPALQGCAGPKPSQPATFVLVHGAWHGGWCWDAVAERLRAHGHAVHAPTLPGMAEDADAASPATDLDVHTQAVVQRIDTLGLRDIVLVGHSYGGMVISGVADQRAQAIRHLVYLDALVPRDGDSAAQLLMPGRWEAQQQAARQHGRGFLMPAPPPRFFGVPDELAAGVAARLTGQPIATFEQPARLPRGGATAVARRTYIACEQPAIAAFASVKQRLRVDPAWRYETLATGHDAMLTAPEPLTQLLLAAARQA